MSLAYSIEAEQAVLGALMLDASAMDRIATRLLPEAFADERNRMIYGVLRKLAASSSPLDLVSVYERMREDNLGDLADLAYLNDLTHCVATAANVERHAAIVTEKAGQRAILAAIDQAQIVARDAGTSAEKLDAIAALFSPLERASMRKMPRRLSEIALERTAHYEALEREEVAPGWPTGLPRLDRMLTGGLRPGKLYILAARPSVGKSSLSMSILLAQARAGRPSLFLSQEMEDTEVADRAVANTGRVQYGSLLSGKMDRDGWQRATDALDDLGGMDLFVDDESSMNLLGIKAKARTVRNLKVLVVDYIQLCASGLQGENRNTQIEELTRGLKSMAKDMGIAILALSQLNRDVEKRPGKRPQLSDLRDSGAIEQDADAVMFLWPLREDEGSQIRSIGCSVAKNRQGDKGAFVLAFEGGLQRWAESTESVEEATRASARPARSGGYE